MNVTSSVPYYLHAVTFFRIQPQWYPWKCCHIHCFTNVWACRNSSMWRSRIQNHKVSRPLHHLRQWWSSLRVASLNTSIMKILWCALRTILKGTEWLRNQDKDGNKVLWPRMFKHFPSLIGESLLRFNSSHEAESGGIIILKQKHI